MKKTTWYGHIKKMSVLSKILQFREYTDILQWQTYIVFAAYLKEITPQNFKLSIYIM